MHDRPAIRGLREAGASIREIAREQEASKDAVCRAIAPGARDRYYRPSLADAAEPAVRDVLADYPAMSVADVAVLIDWRHSRRTLSDLVARLRPEYVSQSPIDARPLTSIAAGLLSVGDIQCGTLQLGTLTIGPYPSSPPLDSDEKDHLIG